MHIRRLVKAGQTSHTVSLPKEWLDKHNLKKGDAVYLLEHPDGLIISPEMKKESREKKEINITVEKKSIDTVKREITSAYINNYSTIIISGAGLNSYAKELRETIHDFVALEIAEQTNNRIVAKDLLNLKEVSVDQTIRRMDMILRSMFQDCADGQHDSLFFKDYDMNRLYFLIFRLLKSSLNDESIAKKFGLAQSQVLSCWYLALNLENLADQLKSLPELKGFKSAKEIISALKELYVDAITSNYKKDKQLADSVSLKRQELTGKIDSLGDAALESNLKTTLTVVNNVARVVIDED